MTVYWRTYPHQFLGNSFGLATANAGYQQALRLAGYDVIPCEGSAPPGSIVLHWTQPDFYEPIPHALNLYGAVIESLNVRPIYRMALTHPFTTAIWTPSTFCRERFRQQTWKQIFICGHGIDHDVFTYTSRTWEPGEPFVFLYVGARNPRKGIDFLDEWWRTMGFYRHPGLLLYCKTTLGDAEREAIADEMRSWGEPVLVDQSGFVLREGNMLFDARPCDPATLATFYRAAHCFLFPSRGEGFGLTLAEAMATGLPCIATRFGGYLDFCDEDTAFLFGYRPAPFHGTDGGVFVGARPDPRAFLQQVQRVTNDYPAALDVGKRAATRVRREVTWERVGQQMRQMIETVLQTHHARAGTQQAMPTASL